METGMQTQPCSKQLLLVEKITDFDDKQGKHRKARL